MAARTAAKGATRVAKPTKKAVLTTSSAKKAASGRITGLPKAGGEAPMRACFAKLADHRAIGERIDAIVRMQIPQARRAIKWSSPLWPLEGGGWSMGFGSYKHYAKLSFFPGSALTSPALEGDGRAMRGVNVTSLADLDVKQMTTWIKQPASMPGWGR